MVGAKEEGDVCRRQICPKYMIYLRGIVFVTPSTIYNRYTLIKNGGGDVTADKSCKFQDMLFSIFMKVMTKISKFICPLKAFNLQTHSRSKVQTKNTHFLVKQMALRTLCFVNYPHMLPTTRHTGVAECTYNSSTQEAKAGGWL